MQWTPEAEAALAKVPFFVRKKVRTRVEEEALKSGRTRVTLDILKLTQKQYLAGMSREIKGYNLETCFGTSGCPNRVLACDRMIERLESVFQAHRLRRFLETRVQGSLRYHHEFRLAVSDCPNACSQPQIKDIGIIAAVEPVLCEESCSSCGSCVEACSEEALLPKAPGGVPLLNPERCMRCGQCLKVCPTGAITAGRSGYRILLGGKLGRHPRLGQELPGLFSEDEVVEVVDRCLLLYKEACLQGERFAKLMQDADFRDRILAEIGGCGGAHHPGEVKG